MTLSLACCCGEGVDFYYLNRIGGGVFGGHVGVLETWHEHFYRMLRRYIASGRFAGKYLL